MSIPSIALPGVHGYRIPRSIAGPARMLHSLQPDLVEVGDACHSALGALRAKRRLQVPVVAFYHSDLPQLIGRRFGNLALHAAKKYLAQVYRQCDMVLAPSKMMVQQLASMGIADAIHQPLGIDSKIFCPEQCDSTLRERLGLPFETRLLIFAGRFTYEKKLGVLIRAVQRLGRPYHLILIGQGCALPRSHQTTILPFQRDAQLLARLLASADVLVHPGDCETFGLIVLEAMACGLPVVGTTGGGVAELVDDSTGVLVSPNCVASLSEGIEAIFQRDRVMLSANARQKARDEYDWNRIVPQLLHRYAGLLQTHHRAELEAESFYAVNG